MGQTGLTTEEHVEIWRRYRTGESMRSISRALRPSLDQIRVIAATGGRSPRWRSPSGRRLSLAEREEISRGVAAWDSGRRIARGLGRAPSTVSREIAGNGGRRHYRARRAEAAARRRARRPKVPKLAQREDLDDPGQPLAQRQRDAADVLAAAVRQLLTVDHGFADAPPLFTDVYVGDALGGRGGEPLEPL